MFSAIDVAVRELLVTYQLFQCGDVTALMRILAASGHGANVVTPPSGIGARGAQNRPYIRVHISKEVYLDIRIRLFPAAATMFSVAGPD